MDIAQILRSQGFKVTPQRIAIYDALRGHHDHPTAEMLYHTLRPEHPSMSLATVYKTMEIFAKIGVVKIFKRLVLLLLALVHFILHLYFVAVVQATQPV